MSIYSKEREIGGKIHMLPYMFYMSTSLYSIPLQNNIISVKKILSLKKTLNCPAFYLTSWVIYEIAYFENLKLPNNSSGCLSPGPQTKRLGHNWTERPCSEKGCHEHLPVWRAVSF